MRPIWKQGLFAGLVSSQLIAQQSPTPTWYPAHSIGGSAAPSIPAIPMEMLPAIAPVFVEDGKTSSSLVVVNNSGIKAGATITVRTLSGSEIVNIHRALRPHEQQEIPLQSLLSDLPARPSIGSITVAQDSDLKGLTVASQLLLTRREGQLPSYVDEELAMPGIDGSGALRGVTDGSAASALLAVSSNVSWVQHLTLHCLSLNTEYKPATLTLAPQATLLISSCSGHTVNDLRSFEDHVGSGTEQRIEGYELATDGGSGTIAAFGLAPHRRNQDIVFSGVPFEDPSKINSPNSIFAGVPFGPQPTLPDGIYSPRMSLSNFSNEPAHIALSIATTQQNEGSVSNEPGRAPEKRLLRQLTIAPRRTVEFALSDASSQTGLLQSVIVESDRKPGEILGKVVSRSDGTLYEIELLAKDQMDENNGGIHPWTVEGDFESHLLLFNYSNKPRVFGVGISNGAIVWDKKYTLAPYETREISFNQLIQDKVKDDNGQTLSSDRQRGAVNWMVPDPGEGTGRLMVTSHSGAQARNFSCGNYVVVCGGSVSNPLHIIPMNSFRAPWTALPSFCDVSSPGRCTGGSYVSSGAANYSWSTSPLSVITPNTSADYYVATPDIYGVGPGVGYGRVTMSANGCQVTGTGSSVEVLAISSISPSTIPVGGSGTSVTISGSGFGSSPTLNLPPGVSASTVIRP